MLVAEECSLCWLGQVSHQSFSSSSPVFAERPECRAHSFTDLLLSVVQARGDAAFDHIEACRNLFDIVAVGGDEDLEPFCCRDTRWLSLVAGSRCDVV